MPKLYVDRGLMTQAVFNLLDNAIKYFHGDPASFKIEIDGCNVPTGYEIVFRDGGMGVPDGLEEHIFKMGFRGPNACESDVTGEGLGLWFARGIVRRHDGDLVLRRHRDPTEFVIVLPRYLAQSPPRERASGEDEP